jgi:hypothetical protein
MRAKACLLAVLLATAASAGCAEYHYYDISVKFNDAPMMFNGSEVSRIQNCVVTVSGADSFEFSFGPEENCPPQPTGSTTNGGTFEYSSTADSGTMTFTYRAYVGAVFQDCLVGEGSTSVPVGPTTATGMLVVNRVSDITSCNR